MGRFLLIGRLAARDLRRRPAEAALLLLAITAATTTLTLGLVLHDVASDPYQRTREATAGPDVVATVSPDSVQNQPADRASLEALTDAAGVVDHSGPYPVTGAVLEARRQRATAQVEGRDPEAAAVDQPKLTQGNWVDDGGVVIEAAFDDALGVRAGDQITLNGRSFQVVGVAVTAAVPAYPSMSPTGTAENPLQYCVPYPDPCDQQSQTAGDPSPELRAAWRRSDAEHPGLVWLTQTDARSVVPEGESPSYVLNLKLDDPAEASAFVDTYLPSGRSPEVVRADGPSFQSWQQIRDQIAADLERNQQEVLLIGSRLLTLLAVASVAVLVGGRMADQTRRVGLLKAGRGTRGRGGRDLCSRRPRRPD